MKTLHLSNDLEDEIRRQCEASYPLEACGLLIGHKGAGGQYSVTEIVPSPNMAEQPEKSFEIDPALIIDCHRKAPKGGECIIGHYHSHPDGKAQPSGRDHRQNYDASLIWVIVGMGQGQMNEIKSYAVESATGILGQIIYTH